MSDAEYNPYAAPQAPSTPYRSPPVVVDATAQAIATIRSRRKTMTAMAYVFVGFVVLELGLTLLALIDAVNDGEDSLVGVQGITLLSGLFWVLWLYCTAELVYPLRQSTTAKPRHPLFWHYIVPLASLYLCFKDLDNLWTYSTIPPEERDGLSFDGPWGILRVYWAARIASKVLIVVENPLLMAGGVVLECVLACTVVYTLTKRATAFANQRIERASMVFDGNLYGY